MATALHWRRGVGNNGRKGRAKNAVDGLERQFNRCTHTDIQTEQIEQNRQNTQREREMPQT